MNQRQNSEKAFRILVPVGEPDYLAVLLAIATPLARSRHGHIIVVYVGESDSQPAWLVAPDEAADTVQDLRVIHRHDIGNAILDCVRDIQPDLLILHWKGKPSRGRYLLGKTLDPVIQYASCDVAVVHVREKPSAFREHMAHLQRLLIPYGPGPNASLALEMALDLAPKAQVTPLRIASHHLGPTAMSAQWDILHDALEEAPQRDRLQPSVIRANSIAEGIRQEAQRGYDMVLSGAAAAYATCRRDSDSHTDFFADLHTLSNT